MSSIFSTKAVEKVGGCHDTPLAPESHYKAGLVGFISEDIGLSEKKNAWFRLVKLVGQTLMVMLEWIDSRKHRQAAEAFCHKLNQKGIRMPGALDVKLSFYNTYPVM